MWSCLEKNEPLDLGVEVGELKKKTLCIHWARKKKARHYSNWISKRRWKKDKDLEVGRISAKQLTTGRVVTKSPIHLPPPSPPPPFITREFPAGLSPIPPSLMKGWCSKYQLLNSLLWQIYIINSVDNTKPGLSPSCPLSANTIY